MSDPTLLPDETKDNDRWHDGHYSSEPICLCGRGLAPEKVKEIEAEWNDHLRDETKMMSELSWAELRSALMGIMVKLKGEANDPALFTLVTRLIGADDREAELKTLREENKQR